MFYRNKRPKQNMEIPQGGVVTPPSYPLVIIVVALVLIGILAVFSSSAPKSIYVGAPPWYFLVTQLGALFVGCLGLGYFLKKDYKSLIHWAIPLCTVVIILLLAVKFTPLGTTVNGAKRWISLCGITLQPSELAKLAVILAMSKIFSSDKSIFAKENLFCWGAVALMLGLILWQPNLSMVLLLCIFSAAIIVIRSKYFAQIIVLGIISFVTFCCAFLSTGKYFLQPYQWQRVEVYMHPEIDPLGASYNILQSLYALAMGGFWGCGYGNSVAKRQWLPEGHTDFIFAVIGEEFGFLGCLLIILLFLAFIHYGFIIASRCSNMFGKLVAVGITLSIGVQSLINMSVASGLIPATGVTLPFVSYGGTSLIVTLSMVGILLNISRKRIRKLKPYERI